MGSGALPKTTVYENSLLLHPQMQVETLPFKEETISRNVTDFPGPKLI